MFDNITHRTTYGGPAHVEVDHKYAPTSDQIRMLREIEKEVKDSFLNSIRVADNKFNFDFHIRLNGERYDAFEMICNYSLNGITKVVSHTFRRFEQEPKDALRETFRKLADDIMMHFITTSGDEIMKQCKSIFGTQL